MCLNSKFSQIEIELSSLIEKSKDEFDVNYQTITRKQSAKGMLMSGNTMSMIGELAITLYQKYLERILELITDIFNGSDRKIYTRFGVNKLINLVKNLRHKLKNILSKELHNKLNEKALGGDGSARAKMIIENKFEKELDYIDKEMDLKLSSKMSNIKYTSWRTSWLYQSFSTILTSAITAIIVSLITKYYL